MSYGVAMTTTETTTTMPAQTIPAPREEYAPGVLDTFQEITTAAQNLLTAAEAWWNRTDSETAAELRAAWARVEPLLGSVMP